MSELDKVTTRFGRAYDRNKKAKGWLEKQQQKLFARFNAELEGQQRGQRSVEIPPDQNQDDYVKHHHPGWQICGVVSGTNHVILEEDPTKMAFTYINRDTGMVYGRTTVTGTPSLDDERLRAEDPALWERISEWPEPWWSLVKSTCRHWTSMTWTDGAIEDVADSILRDCNMQRVMKSIDQFSTTDLVDMQEYILPGAVNVRLVPPRAAKEEEYEV